MARRTAHFRKLLRTPLGISSAILLGIVLLLAIFAPVLWSSDASAIDTFNILQGQSGKHLLGTNDLGQDIFYRVLVASRLSVALALVATAIGVGCGLVLGTAPLIVGRRAGRVITSVINVAVAFPALLLALFFAIIFGVGAQGALSPGSACSPATSCRTSASPSSSTPPSPPATRCCPSPACPSSVLASRPPPTTGASCSTTASRASTPGPPPPSPPASRSWSRASRSTCSARPWPSASASPHRVSASYAPP